MAYIKQGYGFNVGQDFARAAKDMPIEIRVRQGGFTYGTIAGNPESILGFMRMPTVSVKVPNSGIAEDPNNA
jgi:hypothetical protein